MNLINSFYVDENNNKWDSSKYTEIEVINRSKSFSRCYNCSYNSYSSYCYDCYKKSRKIKRGLV